ncbi:MAG: hypothetical protein PHS37_07445 [Candidatus Omnitrophica bacterium]|nr:hypothetical protein [Candidatus Omnitrophota bacterium]
MRGEIFLNPELKDILRYAYNNNINLTARCGVNLNTASDELLECIVKYRFKVMLVSIDGATNATYRIYRRGGNLEDVIGHIKKINFFKSKYKTEFPHLVWQFIVFGHNEHESDDAKKMAESLGMRFVLKLNNHDPAFSPPKNFTRIRKELGYASIEEYERLTRKKYMFSCHQLWYAPQITCDGRLVGCCHNGEGVYGDYGNVFVSGLKRCLGSEKYGYAKKMILGRVPYRDDIPCSRCAEYEQVRAFNMNPVLDIVRQFVWFYK